MDRNVARNAASPALAAAVALAAFFATATDVRADEGGVSFWLPGQFGSLAAVPGAPGFALPVVYYHGSVDAGGSREFVLGGNVVAGLDAQADLVFFAPTWVFAEPVLGGQASLGMAWAYGRMKAAVNATLTGPKGNVIQSNLSDSTTGGSDLYPTGSIKWNQGVHNWMVYTMGDIPVGAYRAGRLANVGIGHWAWDAGGGYTYFDPKKGHEFSIVGGVTYNWENDDTDYQNGVDGHIDWAASQFLNEQVHVGVVGYFYHQLTGDSGSGARLGDFKSRVNGIGPQVGYFFPVGKQKGYVNLKGYWEWDAKNRPEGWNVWVSLALPLSTGE